MKQADLGLNLTTKRTRKREFLAQMERVVPWSALVQLVAPHAPVGKKGARRAKTAGRLGPKGNASRSPCGQGQDAHASDRQGGQGVASHGRGHPVLSRPVVIHDVASSVNVGSFPVLDMADPRQGRRTIRTCDRTSAPFQSEVHAESTHWSSRIKRAQRTDTAAEWLRRKAINSLRSSVV